MSDNLQTTPGSGSDPFVATDQLPDGTHVQKIKLVDGTADGSTPAVVTALGALKVDGSAVTQPVSGAVTANIGSANGLALDATLTGGTQKTKLVDAGGINAAGVSAAGALSVDGSAVTQPVNVTQWAGGSVAKGHGTAANAIRVELPTDGTGIVGLAAGSNSIGSLAANQSVNVSQMNGVATSMGNGATDTGTQRVTLSSDSTGQVKLAAGTNTIGSIKVTDGTNTATVKAASTAAVAADTAIVVVPTTNAPATYSASTGAVTPAASATDVAIINGSASKTIRVKRVILCATQTTAGTLRVALAKRSTANSGGTSATATNVPYDSNNAAATATVISYTANPTSTGTLAGNIRSDLVLIPAAASLVSPNAFMWDFSGLDKQGIVLRGTAQGLAVNFNGVTLTGGSLSVDFEWTEE